jgi:hypothetical protein
LERIVLILMTRRAGELPTMVLRRHRGLRREKVAAGGLEEFQRRAGGSGEDCSGQATAHDTRQSL